MWGMKAVGIKQLKTHLSDYIRLVKGGETILVTDRDEVVAEMRPARRQASRVGPVEETLELLAETGQVTRASLSKKGWAWKPRPIGLPTGAAKELLDELRAD